MNGDLQNRIDAIRQYVTTAAGGVSIGAALMIVAPVELMGAIGLENGDQAVAVRTAIVAGAIALAARATRITVRRK